MLKTDCLDPTEGIFPDPAISCAFGTASGPMRASGVVSAATRRQTSNPEGNQTMKENEFQSRLQNLLEQIDTLPESERPKLAKLAEETQLRHTRMKKTIGELQESLDHLRLSVKYLVFDLEATRRENKYLRNMLENGNGAEGAD
tara:strand:- start:5532 stop:5963 length:432 start_codon:yes stop_codon:yes gene_type:complete